VHGDRILTASFWKEGMLIQRWRQGKGDQSEGSGFVYWFQGSCSFSFMIVMDTIDGFGLALDVKPLLTVADVPKA
jgi:hypothetical protein